MAYIPGLNPQTEEQRANAYRDAGVPDPLKANSPSTPAATGSNGAGQPGNWTTNPTSGINEFVPIGSQPSWERPTLYGGNNPYSEFTKPVDEQKIRDSILSSQQNVISSINEQFATQLASQMKGVEQQGAENAARVRALNVSSGNAGSPIASSNAATDSANTQKVRDAVTRESDAGRAAAIQQILGRANDRADQMIQAAKQERLGAVNASAQYLEKIKGEATADVAKIAASGNVPLDQFKNSTAFQEYMKQTGKNAGELELLYAASSPQKSIEFHTVGKTLAAFQVNPDGTRTRRTDLDVHDTEAAKGDYEIKTDSNGNVVYVPKTPDATKPNGGIIYFNQDGSKFGDKPTTDYQQQQLDLKQKGLEQQMAIQEQRIKLAQEKLNQGAGVDSSDVKGFASADAQDVLEGRNTLFNIRQTMGRSKDAAAYMQSIRSLIRQKDSKFDFVASDAGGKFVSSEYYQKANSAINSVMPNIDKVVQLSDQVQRVGVKGVDEMLQKGAVQIGDKKVANFRQAQKLIADEIGVALGAGTVSDMKLQLGFDVTDPSVSPEVFASNMAIVKEFIDNRKKGLEQQRYSSSTVGNNAGSTGGDPAAELDDDIKQLGRNYTTREQLIAALKNAYPELTPDQIAKRVYSLIPDTR